MLLFVKILYNLELYLYLCSISGGLGGIGMGLGPGGQPINANRHGGGGGAMGSMGPGGWSAPTLSSDVYLTGRKSIAFTVFKNKKKKHQWLCNGDKNLQLLQCPLQK